MKILLITGFLGAGKTTFIKALAKATGREFVIVENEFGEQAIDGQVLSQAEAVEQMEIWEIAEGCICCSLKLDFSLSVLTIANTLNPDYLLVEPSGVAQPTQIIESLSKISYDRISLLAPITLIDADNYHTQRHEFKNYFEDQLIAAGTVVVSKSEHMEQSEFDRMEQELAIPSDVSFPKQHYSLWDKERWLGLLEKDFTGQDIARVGERFSQRQLVRQADQALRSVTLKGIRLNNPDELYHCLEQIVRGRYGQVVRAKGFVELNRQTVHVELVANKFSLTGLGQLNPSQLPTEQLTDQAVQGMQPVEWCQNCLVVIGKNLDRSGLSKALMIAE